MGVGIPGALWNPLHVSSGTEHKESVNQDCQTGKKMFHYYVF